MHDTFPISCQLRGIECCLVLTQLYPPAANIANSTDSHLLYNRQTFSWYWYEKGCHAFEMIVLCVHCIAVELRALLLGLSISSGRPSNVDEDVKFWMKEFDRDQDNVIDLGDFCNVLHRYSAPLPDQLVDWMQDGSVAAVSCTAHCSL